MNTALLDLADRLVSISDFSQGKAGKIFNDVAENNTEYIVLKNNQPTAVCLRVNSGLVVVVVIVPPLALGCHGTKHNAESQENQDVVSKILAKF